MTARRDRLLHHFAEVVIRQVAADHDRLHTILLDQRGQVDERAEGGRVGRSRRVQVAEHRVLAAGGERATGGERAALLGRSDEQRARGGRRPADDARVHDLEGEPEGHERDPDHGRRNRELSGDEPQAAVPQRRPQWQRGRQQTTGEQPLRGAARVPRPVVAGDEQADDQCDGELPAVEVAGGQECLDRSGDECAQRFALSDEAIHLTQHRERREVRGEQHQESHRGALQVAPEVAWRATLQVHRGAGWPERSVGAPPFRRPPLRGRARSR